MMYKGQHEIDFDMSSIEHFAPAAIIQESSVLPPHMHYIDFSGIDGHYDWHVFLSSIGIIDSRLHIQQIIDMTVPWNPPDSLAMKLIDPDGDIVQYRLEPHWTGGLPGFIIDENGSIVCLREDNTIRVINSFYQEYIYDIDYERLSDYKLIVEYERGNHIEFSFWKTTFTIG